MYYLYFTDAYPPPAIRSSTASGRTRTARPTRTTGSRPSAIRRRIDRGWRLRIPATSPTVSRGRREFVGGGDEVPDTARSGATWGGNSGHLVFGVSRPLACSWKTTNAETATRFVYPAAARFALTCRYSATSLVLSRRVAHGSPSSPGGPSAVMRSGLLLICRGPLVLSQGLRSGLSGQPTGKAEQAEPYRCQPVSLCGFPGRGSFLRFLGTLHSHAISRAEDPEYSSRSDCRDGWFKTQS